jgi:MarR family transcriptional regulator, organic hydroperoxide resistance regulator
VAEVLHSSRAEEFLDGFDALAAAVRRARGAPAQAEGPALTLSQYGLLQGLVDRGSARARELADAAGIAPSTATRIIDALERRGIVRRRRADDDRRAVAITLTPLGHEVLHAQDEWLRGRQRAFFEALPPEEKALAPDLLVRLAALIDELAAGCAD